MRYQPVKVVHVVERLYRGRDARKDGHIVERGYFQARSKLLGSCGHRHRTEEAAGPCALKMRAEWASGRSAASKAAWAARRGVSPG